MLIFFLWQHYYILYVHFRHIWTSPSGALHHSAKLGNELGRRAEQGNVKELSSSSTSRTNSTFKLSEIEKFRVLSEDWWKSDGPLRTLHSMNTLRVPLIRDGLLSTLNIDETIMEGPRPLQRLKILDVGCGGGVLAEPLARLGANVTGVSLKQLFRNMHAFFFSF